MKKAKELSPAEKRRLTLIRKMKIEIDKDEAKLSMRLEKLYDKRCQMVDQIFGPLFNEAYEGEGCYIIPMPKSFPSEEIDMIILIAGNRYGISIKKLFSRNNELAVMITEKGGG